MQETDRRRKIQLDYNKKYKIDAKSVKKEISDILESVYEKDYVKISEGSNVGGNLKKQHYSIQLLELIQSTKAQLSLMEKKFLNCLFQ